MSWTELIFKVKRSMDCLFYALIKPTYSKAMNLVES